MTRMVQSLLQSEAFSIVVAVESKDCSVCLSFHLPAGRKCGQNGLRKLAKD